MNFMRKNKVAFGEREFPFQKSQKTALCLASVYCEGEGIAAVFSHFQFSTADAVCSLSHTSAA